MCSPIFVFWGKSAFSHTVTALSNDKTFVDCLYLTSDGIAANAVVCDAYINFPRKQIQMLLSRKR